MAALALVLVTTALLGRGADAAAPDESAPLAQLAQRATRVADVAEIKRLQAIYGYYIDRSMWDDIVDLMTDDVTLEYGGSGVYVGKAQARALLYGIGYGQYGLLPGQLRDHTQLQPVITLAADGRTAQGRWHALVLLGQFKQYARWQTGPYENTYRKENGRWKISSLHWFETFTVPFVGGWQGSMPQSNVADRRLPAPDRPPSIAHVAWPGVLGAAVPLPESRDGAGCLRHCPRGRSACRRRRARPAGAAARRRTRHPEPAAHVWLLRGQEPVG